MDRDIGEEGWRKNKKLKADENGNILRQAQDDNYGVMVSLSNHSMPLGDFRVNIYTRIIVGVMIILLSFDFFQLCNPAFAAEEPEETKIEIELEKQAIVVKIERPSIAFPVRWKNPDFPEEREYLLKQDFRDEIRKLTGEK